MRPELIQATDLLRRNTPEAVDEAIGLLQNTVYSFSMKVCGHPEDAEDTMQEVLYRSLGHLAKIQDPQALAVWLYTVTRNRCWRMRRKGASAPKHIQSLDELMPDEAELGRLLQDAAAGPEANLLHAEQHHMLPGPQRQARALVPHPGHRHVGVAGAAALQLYRRSGRSSAPRAPDGQRLAMIRRRSPADGIARVKRRSTGLSRRRRLGAKCSGRTI